MKRVHFEAGHFLKRAILEVGHPGRDEMRRVEPLGRDAWTRRDEPRRVETLGRDDPSDGVEPSRRNETIHEKSSHPLKGKWLVNRNRNTHTKHDKRRVAIRGVAIKAVAQVGKQMGHVKGKKTKATTKNS